MNFDCPNCDYSGEFKNGKIPFFVYGILDAGRERRRAKRTHVCPQCGTEIVLPKKPLFGKSKES